MGHRYLVCGCLLVLAGGFACAQGVQPKFQFIPGSIARYELDLHHDISLNNYDPDSTRNGTLERPTVLKVTVQSLMDAGGVMKIQLDGQPDWLGKLTSSVVSSSASYPLDARGFMPGSFPDVVTVSGLEPGDQYANQVQGFWAEEALYLSVDLPNHAVKEGDSWNVHIPAKIVGGLGGQMGANFVFADARATVTAVTTIDGERCLEATISFAPNSSLQIANMKISNDISDASGKFVFSLDRGNLVSYSASFHVETKTSLDDKLKQLIRTDFSFDLKRLGK